MKQLRTKTHFKEREVATAMAICSTEDDGRVFVHNLDGTIDYVIEGDYLREIRQRMVRELTKTGAIPKTRRTKCQN